MNKVNAWFDQLTARLNELLKQTNSEHEWNCQTLEWNTFDDKIWWKKKTDVVFCHATQLLVR